MSNNDNYDQTQRLEIKVAQLEDQIALYRPLVTKLQKIDSIEDALAKIQSEFRLIQRDRRDHDIKMAQFEQTCAKIDTIIESQNNISEKVIRLDSKVEQIEKTLNNIEKRFEKITDTTFSFTVQSIIKYIPWIIAAGVLAYTLFCKIIKDL